MEKKIAELVAATRHILIVQADNPDADSLGSALALETILGDLGKTVNLYCGVDIPTYLRYLPGWDRVSKDLPKQFDLSIIVDANTYTLLEQLYKTTQLNWLKSKPAIVIDHHEIVDKQLEFATARIIRADAASTGDIIFDLSKQCEWPVSKQAAELLMTSILGDTQGLTNELTSADTYRTMAELTDIGADRPKLEELRREASKMAEVIYRYKGELIRRTQFAADGRIAYVTVQQDDINRYSPLYNPAALIQFDMLQIQDVELTIVFKTYDDGHVTGAIRSSKPVAGRLAEQLGGGGHKYASGFKTDGRQDFDSVKTSCLEYATELLSNLTQD